MNLISIGCINREFKIPVQLIEFISANKIGHLELLVDDIDKSSPIYDKGYLRELAMVSREYGFTLSLHSHFGINLSEKIDRIRKTCVDIILDILEVGESIDAQFLTIHLGNCGFNHNYPKKYSRLDNAILSLNELSNNTRGYNIKIGIENLTRLNQERNKCYIGDCPEDFRYLFEHIQSKRIGMVFDLGHSNINTNVLPQTFIEGFTNKVIAFHLHWNNGVEDLHNGLTKEWFIAQQELWHCIEGQAKLGKPIILENHDLRETEISLNSLSKFIKKNKSNLD